jgi:hypothetical protein
VQDDEFASHTHAQTIQAPDWNAGMPAGSRDQTVGGPASRYPGQLGNDAGQQTLATGGPETRPKNVALLYCRKD